LCALVNSIVRLASREPDALVSRYGGKAFAVGVK
jgi:hypothetical protein